MAQLKGSLMFTRDAKKLLSIMAKPEQTMIILGEGVEELSKIHEEYLENAPRVDWIEMGDMIHMDTQYVDVERILLQHEKPEVVGNGKTKSTGNYMMINQGVASFVPYESFTFLELLTAIALSHILQGYIIKEYKEKNKGEEESKYQLDTFIDYSLVRLSMHLQFQLFGASMLKSRLI